MGLGLKAIARGYRVLFTTAAAMLTTLTRALSEGRFDDKLKVYTDPAAIDHRRESGICRSIARRRRCSSSSSAGATSAGR